MRGSHDVSEFLLAGILDLNGTVVQHGTVSVRQGLTRIDYGKTSVSQKVNVYTVLGQLMGSYEQGAIPKALLPGT